MSTLANGLRYSHFLNLTMTSTGSFRINVFFYSAIKSYQKYFFSLHDTWWTNVHFNLISPQQFLKDILKCLCFDKCFTKISLYLYHVVNRIWENCYILAPEPKLTKLKALSFLKLLKLMKIKCLGLIYSKYKKIHNSSIRLNWVS